MDESPLNPLKSLVQQAEVHLEAKDWAFLGHVLNQAAMEAMAVAEKAQGGGHDLDPDYDGEGY